MDDIIIELDKLADDLYNERTDGYMERFIRMFKDIELLVAGLSDLDVLNSLTNKGLLPALKAMESNDTTLLADIIVFEIIGIIKGL